MNAQMNAPPTAAPSASGGEPAVLHFLARWLPASEGFVYDLVRGVRRRAVVVSSGRLENTARFPSDHGPPVLSLASVQALTPRPLRQKVVTATLVALARRHGVGIV
ncbi:MAG TPA: hypothetical protein VG012_07240, partial [Acidimicrobiia bacterium]|nr:hypothetical protein [Acidimicrobiia bacterium]